MAVNKRLAEWRDTNEEIRFPFADDSTLTTTDGEILGVEVFVDAFFHPIDLQGPLYLSLLDTVTRVAAVSDDTGQIATASITDDLELVFRDSAARFVGRAVLNGPLDDFIAGTWVFPNTATTLAPAVVFPQNQLGVRGFVTPDGTILTGEVEFEGVGGVQITSEIDVAGQQLLRFDAIGVAAEPDCVELGPAVECLYIDQLNLGNLTISRTDNAIFLGHRNELADICNTKQNLPDENGVLPVDGPPPPATGPVLTPFAPFVPPVADCIDHEGEYFITSLTDALSVRPTQNGIIVGIRGYNES
jgi:hypothetical protein